MSELSTSGFETVWNDGEFLLSRGADIGASGPVLVLALALDQPSPTSIARLRSAYELRDELDSGWAARPLEIVDDHGKLALLIEDHGGEVLARLLGKPWELEVFLRAGTGIAAALRRMHQRGFVHKDIKPGNVFVNTSTGEAWLSGFGLASRLSRQRQAPEPPETIAGTLPYMAPEQTGRMNRSIDSRSDLYSLGVTLYQMLTGSLPFTASDPMEWVHCHIARRPMPPSERLETVPVPVSQILMKLLAKTAEERYQTAAGVESDLRRCLAEWETHLRIDEFPLGQHDTPDRLLIPEKLYGRAREVDTLLEAFDRIFKGGAPELVLVSGYSGIGKSSVVNELHKVLVPPRGLFASGKFDQYKRDIPYSTLAQAFQGLIRHLLGKSDAELASWREALQEALGPNAGLMTDLIAELKLIIGDPPPVPELEPQQAQSRFQLVFRRFIGVFARPEHPLALFLDDLQWLDAATLDLLEDLLTRSDMQHLMLIGAYRDNEVDAAHPLTRRLDAIRQAGARVQEIRLAPLARDDLKQLIADALRCDPAHVAPLAQLVHEKTAGNPFFVIQFLYSLAEEGLLRFDHDAACWSWDLDRIHAKGYTDNVVDLMVGKLTRLPLETQQALQQLACLGHVAAIAMLSHVLGTSEEQVHAALWPAARQELTERLEGRYRFIHDRVHEAAYSLIPGGSRAEAHLRIGRLLVVQTPPEKREEAIFEIVNQLNRGAQLITQQEEREQLAELNLLAGKRAKGSTAYASALSYLIAGAELLKDDCWERTHELIFGLELNRAECEFLTGQLSVADERLAALSNRATTTVEQAFVACLHMDVCTALTQSSRAVVVSLNYLRHVGIEWSPRPKEEEVRLEYDRIWSLLVERTIEDLIHLPLMEDAASLATVDVLSKLFPPAQQTDANLASLTICKAVSLSLERGNCDASCFAYVMLGRIAGPRFGDYKAGFRFGQLGYELVERRGLKRFEASTYLCYAIFVVRWMKHVRACRDLLRRAFEAANRIGDLTYGAYSCNCLNTDLLFAGEPLPEVQGEAEHGLAFAEKAHFGLVIDFITTQLALIRMLRGLTPKFGYFDDGKFDELQFERHLASEPALALPECWYWIRKLQARYMAGDYVMAMDSASKAQPLIWTSTSFFEEAEYHFYGALTRAAYCESAPAGEREQHLDALAAHHKQLQVWAENGPENFENRAALVGAEIARLEGRDLNAMRLYEQAIRSARDNDFVHNEGLANELASRFYAARGLEKMARVYLQDARYCYLRWGADGKVRQLDEMYQHLRTDEPAPGPTGTIATPVEHLDLATVIKVSQAISGEIVLEKLIHTLMRTAIEQAGAERGLLILPRGSELRIEAEATTSGDTVAVQLRDVPVTTAVLPESVLYSVLRTRESVILDDASTQPLFAGDPYIRQLQMRSILCLPLINQTKLVGVLYLENNLAPRVFAPARIAVLKLIASQAAISLENTRLYRDLEGREAKIRRLVDANIIGIFIWELEGRILEANDAFLRMMGYDHDDLDSGQVRWTDLTPPEWLERDIQRWVPEMRKTGSLQPYEKEYFRKDGSRVPVLIGAATLDEAGSQGVAFVLDLTDRKRAEEELRDVIDRIPTVAWTMLPDGTNNFTNQSWREYSGLSSKDTSGNGWTASFHSADLATHVEKWNASVKTGSPFENEARLRRARDGEYRWFLHRAVPLRDENGNILKWYGVSSDIDDRKRAEEALRKSEERWRSVFENSAIGVVLSDLNGRFLAANHAYQTMVGYTEEELRVLSFLDVTHEDYLEANWALITELMEGKRRQFQIEKKYRCKDGSLIWVSNNVSVVPGTERVPRFFLVLSEDITERKHAEQALQRSEWYLTEAQRMSKIGNWAGNLVSGEPLYWSEEMFRIWGFDPHQGLPDMQAVLQRIHPEDLERVRESAKRGFEGRLAGDETTDHRIVLPDGTVKHSHGISHNVFDEAGRVVEYVGTSMDVTEQYRNREALEKAFEEIKTLKDQLYKENLALRDEVDRASMFEEIVGASPALESVLARVAKVGPTDSTVLIAGETGTGKELIARAIHKRSRRSGRAFVSVNCSALAPSLISSELFGHEKGSFTGATQRRMGRFELADGGTIFLDEVGELPPEAQVALLRVLQEREFERVGGTQSVRVDVRVIAATNRDLKAAIANGSFRQDLFYRLNVFPIDVPPLRERKADILMLVEYFVQRFARAAGKHIRSIEKKTLELLQSYAWPGNIRELQNVVERSMILSSGDVFSVDESWLPNQSSQPPNQVEVSSPLGSERDEERKIIEAALAESRGRVYGSAGAAAKLGISPSTLDYKIKTLKIRKNQFKYR